MDTNLLLAILLPIIFTVLILEFDEAMMLFLIGFITLAIAFNFSLIFSITDSSYVGFGVIMKIIWFLLPVFAFTRSYFMRGTSKFNVFYGKVNDSK